MRSEQKRFYPQQRLPFVKKGLWEKLPQPIRVRCRELIKEPFDFRLPHICRMSFVMKEDESLYPPNVGFLDHVTVVARTNGLADLIEKLGFWKRCRRIDSWTSRGSISV
jgi:hypothetical protein